MRSMYPTIIFFINGPHPTRDEREEAAQYGPGVRYRNVQFVPDDIAEGAIEVCDGVAGLVPKAYAEKRIPASEAIRLHRASMQEFLSDGGPVKAINSERENGLIKPFIPDVPPIKGGGDVSGSVPGLTDTGQRAGVPAGTSGAGSRPSTPFPKAAAAPLPVTATPFAKSNPFPKTTVDGNPAAKPGPPGFGR